MAHEPTHTIGAAQIGSSFDQVPVQTYIGVGTADSRTRKCPIKFTQNSPKRDKIVTICLIRPNAWVMSERHSFGKFSTTFLYISI